MDTKSVLVSMMNMHFIKVVPTFLTSTSMVINGGR